jgi:uncharacterized membrane protein YhdT
MKEKISVMMKWAVLGNIAHLIVAGLNIQMNKDNMGVMILLTVVSLLVWVLIGYKYGSAEVKGKEADLLFFGLLCILPIFVYVISSQVLQGMAGSFNNMQNYNLFYFLGAPALFWNTPFYPIMKLFHESNIYIQMNINMMLVVLFSFMGAYAGRSFRIAKLKKSRKN